MRRIAAVLALSLLAGALTPASAQVTVRGVVLDSIAGGRPLAGADVWIEGLDRVVRTDGQGRFVFPDVPAGTHRIGFDHATLDRMRIAGPVRTITIGTTDPAPLTLAMPSPATLYAALCGAPSEDNLGVLLGRVRRGTRRVPAGTPVTASWTVWNLGKGGLRQQPKETTTRTDSLGEFKLCGLPSDVPLMLRAQADDGTATAAEIGLDELALGVRELDLPEPADASASDPSPSPGRYGGVDGTVRAAGGRAVPNAQVRLVSSGRTVNAGPDGAFSIADVTPGRQVLEVRAIGFRPVVAPVVVLPGRRTRLIATFDERVTVLATLKVLGARSSFGGNGFEERRRTGGGFYISRSDIEKRRAYSTNDLFAGIPGVEVRLQGFGARVVFTRALGQAGVMANSCEPVYYVDGVRFWATESQDADASSRAVSSVGIDQLLRPSEVEGIEVYRNVATAPPQYQPLNSTCGVILVWTRRRPS